MNNTPDTTQNASTSTSTSTAGDSGGQSAEPSDLFNATMVQRRDLNESLAVVRVQMDSGQVPEFTPGQYATLGLRETAEQAAERAAKLRQKAREKGQSLPDAASAQMGMRLVKRAYSIASSPLDREALEFFVVLVEEGKLTPTLWRMDEGARLHVSPSIKGHFTLDAVPGGKRLFLISTGTGLAPYISMLRTYRGQDRWKQAVVVHGVRHEADLGYRDELEALAEQDPTVCYVPVVSRAPEDSPFEGVRGRVQAALEPHVLEEYAGKPLLPEDAHVFLCGNPVMIQDVERMLTNLGFVTDSRETPGNIHFERYW